MNPVPPLIFPGGRTLAGWWKVLAPLQPQAVSVGHLLLHRVEALARVPQAHRLDVLPFFALKALAQTPGEPLERVDNRLHLGRALLRQVVAQLEAEQLVAPCEGGAWSLTGEGQKALVQGDYQREVNERRVFDFAEPQRPDGPPVFLRLQRDLVFEPWFAVGDWHFDARVLEEVARRPDAWKERHGFPTDVREILLPQTNAVEAPPWQRILLDRPAHLIAVLILVPAADGHEQLQAFAVRRDGWELDSREPVFTLPDGKALVADFVTEPTADDWRQAWRAWCQPRSLPAAEVEACALEPSGWRLRVLANSRLIDRLRSARSDALKGEAWVLAGTGRLRPAARLELVEGGRSVPTASPVVSLS
jgi:hypothetical protein